MSSSAATPSPAGTPNTQPAPSASIAPAIGPPTNAAMTCCAASVRPFAASSRDRGTRSGTSAEPARSTNTSVTPYSSTITVSAAIVMCPDATSQTATPSSTARAASPTTCVYLRSRRSTTTPAASPSTSHGSQAAAVSSAIWLGERVMRQGVQRDARLHDAVAQVGQARWPSGGP